MSEQDDKELGDKLNDDESESSPESAPVAAARPKTKKRVERTGKGVAAQAAPAKPASLPAARAGLFIVLALAAGGAAGWFGHIEKAKAQVRADSAAAPSASGAPAGPCGAWQGKICSSSGEKSAACQQAKDATELLTPSTCEAALTVLPATLTKLKNARASCDTLVAKLCADLKPGSSTCDMVKERTPSFPAQRCEEMLKNYDKVIEELRSIEQQGGIQMAPGGPGGPGGPGHSPDDGHGH